MEATLAAAFEAVIHEARTRDVELSLLPPPDAARLDALERRLGPLPKEFRNLLRRHGGLTKNGAVLDLQGNLPFEFEGLGRAVPVVGDGFGNFWVVVFRITKPWPVLFVSHDPPVIVVQAEGLIEFVRQFVAADTVEALAPRTVTTIWKRDPLLIERSAGLTSPDPAVRAFAATLAPSALIADLRRVQPGDGFAWGRFGHRSILERAEDELLFGVSR